MRYLIIGLGIYGSNLAVDLTNLGNEVIGADRSASIVESIKDYIGAAYILDATDRSALAALPLKNVDTVIVAIGENFGASIRTVALLKELGVEHIYARAIDQLHESILQGFHIDRILTPEQRAAADLTHELEYGPDAASLAIGGGDRIIRFKLPDKYVGVPYGDIAAFGERGASIIAVSRAVQQVNAIGMTRTKHIRVPQADISEVKAEKNDMVVILAPSNGIPGIIR